MVNVQHATVRMRDLVSFRSILSSPVILAWEVMKFLFALIETTGFRL